MKFRELVLDELLRQEALDRMHLLGIRPDLIDEFSKGNLDLSYLDKEKDRAYQEIEKIAKKRDGLVYHVIVDDTPYGRMISLCFVSTHVEDWEFEKKQIQNNTIYAFVVNLDDEFLSEFGMILVENQNGILKRIW